MKKTGISFFREKDAQVLPVAPRAVARLTRTLLMGAVLVSVSGCGGIVLVDEVDQPAGDTYMWNKGSKCLVRLKDGRCEF